MKDDIKGIIFLFATMFMCWLFCYIVQSVIIDLDIKKARIAYEADLKAKGLIEPRHPKRVIYMPLDREDTGRQDSTGVFLKTAKKEFGTQQTGGFETVDYASQADEYDQRVREIKQQEAQRLAEQKKQQAELDKKMGKTPSAHNTAHNTVKKNNKQNTGGTVINRLQTSGRNNNKSTMFKK